MNKNLQNGIFLPLEIVLRGHIRLLTQLQSQIESLSKLILWVNTNAEGITVATRMNKLSAGVTELIQTAQGIRTQYDKKTSEAITSIENTIRNSKSKYWDQLMRHECKHGGHHLREISAGCGRMETHVISRLGALLASLDKNFEASKKVRVYKHKIQSSLIFIQGCNSVDIISSKLSPSSVIYPIANRSSRKERRQEEDSLVPEKTLINHQIVKCPYKTINDTNPIIYSYTMNNQLSLDIVNDGQHMQYLGNRISYSKPDDDKTQMMTRFSVPGHVILSEDDIEAKILSSSYYREARSVKKCNSVSLHAEVL